VVLAVQQLFDFVDRHVDEFLGQGKDFSHGNAFFALAFGKFSGAQIFLGGRHGASLPRSRKILQSFLFPSHTCHSA
jgi:hypothetical protein